MISWASSGQVGFKGSRKSTPFAAQLAAEAAARRAQEHGMKKVDVFVKGPGSGRETAIRSLQAAGLEVGSIQDVTPQAFNGARPPEASSRLSPGGWRSHGNPPPTSGRDHTKNTWPRPYLFPAMRDPDPASYRRAPGRKD